MRFKKGQVPWNKGKARSEETKKKISLANKGKHYSKSTEFKKGSQINLGRKHSIETREKMRNAKKPKGFIKSGYKCYRKFGKLILEHHDVWLRESEWRFIPKGFVVHHKNSDRQDNRIENLACIPLDYHTYIHRFKGGNKNCNY